MSIKTIDQEIRSNTDGVEKRINKGAERMVFDILQATQYSNPIPSTIRELVSNACDSQREKEVAIEILTGEKKSEDYYITRGGEQYEDSNFKADYYDLDYLDKEHNDVEIHYYRNEGTGFCDVVEILDHGVGIGGRRLEGVLELGYSTKRNTSENFGAFGLGAKVALSTGVDFYTIETAHNGKLFKCNCYPYKTDFIIPKFNPSITLSDGMVIHYQPTTSKNYAKISFGIKKHNRGRFEESVKDQLNYLPNVRFFIHEDGEVSEQNFKTSVLYSSDHLIVSEASSYARPHIIVVKSQSALTGINYGDIDFKELELQQMYGSVGFKCPIRQVVRDQETGEEIVLHPGIDVTPSREKVIWNEATKAFVLDMIEQVKVEAADIIAEELASDDFLSWLDTCKSLLIVGTSKTSNKAFEQLGRLMDIRSAKPAFSKDKRIKFASPETVFQGMGLRVVRGVTESGKKTTKTDKVEGWNNVNLEGIYFRDDSVPRGRIKDRYILTLHPHGFNLITNSPLDSLEKADQKLHESIIKVRSKLLEFIQQSSRYKSYEDVVVPDGWEKQFEAMEEAEEIAEKQSTMSPAERREMESRIVLNTLRFSSVDGAYKGFTLDKVEPKVETVLNSPRTTYYATDGEDSLLYAAGIICSKNAILVHQAYSSSWELRYTPLFYVDDVPTRFRSSAHSWNPPVYADSLDKVQLVKISQANLKYFQKNPNCKPITEFFLTVDNEGVLTCDPNFIRYLTSKFIEHPVPHWFQELGNISLMYSDLSKVFSAYSQLFSSEEKTLTEYLNSDKDLGDYIKSLIEFQLILKKRCYTEEELSLKSLQEFGVADVRKVKFVETEILDLYDVFLEFIEGVEEPLENLCSNKGQMISRDYRKEVEFYLNQRGKLEIVITIPQEILNSIK